ncbi:hypothetical protein CERZMDRAFT_85185 [Cercospora zeae-maydis SCOH1-5]|uniref:Transglycosylase SLT domain-containing protein n=1 Tax=Cercospora zeae-maydis SCOH1-5 TaxID=717836 RepID=A0A6A6FEB5_9PEZI|nr:hypothetical protein CERZMDRAFT_85185 [Cercospora zeae-maydis SCOH1-5]
MAILSKIICLSAALIAAPNAFAAPVTRAENCDFGVTTPAGWTDSMQSQWCGMINNEVNGLKSKEDRTAVLPMVTAQYKQAGISCPPESAFPDIDNTMQDSSARAAMSQMKANYPAFGSMDLTPEDIQKVYGDHIDTACSKTGVPADVMVNIIWTESKGHPLVYGGLTQMDYVAWGQMAEQDPSLKNRYMPGDNIVASAMYLKGKKDTNGGDWETTYRNHYQDPNAHTY